MNGLEEEWAGRVQVVRVNIHDPDTRPLAARLGFRFTPTFILFNGDGQEVWRSYGVINVAEARQKAHELEEIQSDS